MLKADVNELLTQTGPGTPAGELFRQYWLPALHIEELPENDCPPVRVKILSERLIAFRDSEGALRVDGRVLRAPRRVALVRARRGRRPALRLPRMEVRRHRPVPRGPVRAGEQQLLLQGEADGVSARQGRRHPLDLHGRSGHATRAAGVRVLPRSRRADVHLEALAGEQLAPGARGRDRFEPRVVAALRRARRATRSSRARRATSTT